MMITLKNSLSDSSNLQTSLFMKNILIGCYEQKTLYFDFGEDKEFGNKLTQKERILYHYYSSM